MQILIFNGGSSSLKCALIDPARRARLWQASEDFAAHLPSDASALESAVAAASESLLAKLSLAVNPVHIDAVAHRVVHGGERFASPTLVDESVLHELDTLANLAPLHNPPAVALLRISRRQFPALPHVAIFDTSFHATLPARARQYALPADVRARFSIRRYGFHGINHARVMQVIAAHLRKSPQELRIISCHLGNGASVAAIEYGRSVETSMGMTPLEGLIMGGRGGDLDPGVLLQLMREYSPEALADLLNTRSGLQGLTGTHDMRQVEERAASGDESCRLALAMYAHRVRKYIGAYAAVMGGVDAIAFTGGVGEHSAAMRHRCTQRLAFLGVEIDEDRNRDATVTDDHPVAALATDESRVPLYAVRADEAWMMASLAEQLLQRQNEASAERRIPVAISARHAHLSQATLDQLFGAGFVLHPRSQLSQKGQFSASETVTLVGPRGRVEHVRLMGPPRNRDQIEISRTDEFVLGIDAPVRISGDLANTPGIIVESATARVSLSSGVICARRHIHMNPADACRLNLNDCETVSVLVEGEGRSLIFSDVSVRVGADFTLEMHLDTDEANAAGVRQGDTGLILRSDDVRLGKR